MGHVHVRKLRLRAFLTASAAATAFSGGKALRRIILTLVATAMSLALFGGSARAATNTADGTMSATIGPGNPSATFTGTVPAGVIADPTLCPPASGDPLNVVCEHFTVITTDIGDLGVIIDAVDDTEDLDVAVFFVDPVTGTQTQVASGISTTDPESVTVTCAQAGTYEIRISGFIILLGDFVGTATFTSNPTCAGPGGGGGGGGGGGLDKMTGGGQTTGSSAQFGINVHEDLKGKIGWSKPGGSRTCKLLKTVIDSADFDPVTETVSGTGHGQLDGEFATFDFFGDDNGEAGTTDVFTIDFTSDPSQDVCDGGGTLLSGNEQYHAV
jgi:hypothetical protein